MPSNIRVELVDAHFERADLEEFASSNGFANSTKESDASVSFRMQRSDGVVFAVTVVNSQQPATVTIHINEDSAPTVTVWPHADGFSALEGLDAIIDE